MNYLVRLPEMCVHISDRIFYRYMLAVCVCELHEELYCSLSLSFSLSDFFNRIALQRAMSRPGGSQVCTRRKCDYHIPLSLDFMLFAVYGFKFAVSVQQRDNIFTNVPFRMPARAIFQVAAISLMTAFAECNADALTFFASHNHFHFSASCRSHASIPSLQSPLVHPFPRRLHRHRCSHGV